MESIGKHLPIAEEEEDDDDDDDDDDEDEVESDAQIKDVKMEDVEEHEPSTTSHGVKRKHEEASASDAATSTTSSPPPQEPPKKPKSLKIRLSLSKGEVKTVKVVDSEQQQHQQQPSSSSSSSAAAMAATSNPPLSTTTKSRQPSSKRIKLSLPKSKPMTSTTTKADIDAPTTSSSSPSSAAAAAAAASSSQPPAKKTSIKKRRSSVGTGSSNDHAHGNSKSTRHNNVAPAGAANAVANATILPMTSPGLLVVGAGKNNLIPPRVIFDQAMSAAGYTTESRSHHPHRGSSVKRVVGDMFDSTTTFTYHFPRLVPHEFLKRPEESSSSSSKTTTPKKLKAPTAPPDVVGTASTTAAASSSSGPATATPATVPSASNETPTPSALPASGDVKKIEEAVLTDVTTRSPADSVGTKNDISTTSLVPTVVVSTASTTDMAPPGSTTITTTTSDGPVPMDTTAEASLVQQSTTEAENVKSITASTTEPPKQEPGLSTTAVAPAPPTTQPQESSINLSSQLQDQPPKQQPMQKEITPSALPEKKGSDLDVRSPEESADNKAKRIKAEARAFALSSPHRPSKGERLLSVAERFIKAFSVKEKKMKPEPTKSKSNSCAAIRSFSGMIPVSLTLPYPDDYLQRQARYLREVRQREKAIVAKQHDIDSIEIAKEQSEILGRPYDGPMASKVVIPPIPQLPRAPKLTEMNALDVEVFGADSKDRLYSLNNTRNDHLDPHCFHITEGRYFGLESNHTADPNFIGPNAPGFNGLTMTATNSLSGMGGSSVPLLSASAMALLEANAKSEASSNKLKGKKSASGSSVQRPPPKRDERGKFISKKHDDKAAKPSVQGQIETMSQSPAAAVPIGVSNSAQS